MIHLIVGAALALLSPALGLYLLQRDEADFGPGWENVYAGVRFVCVLLIAGFVLVLIFAGLRCATGGFW